ncbi:MAG: proton-conducting membrane transporter [Eubacterium sp.]|nr:proton-conducting membrane transporter [Eubacterium sp.]
MDIWILLSISLPSAAGIILLAASFMEHIKEKPQASVKGLHIYTAVVLMLSVAITLYVAWTGERTLTLFTLLDRIPFCFRIDGLSRLFITVVGIVWLVTGFYSFAYMKHEGEEKRFFGLYLLLYGVLAGLAFSGNLVTMYFFYELMTLASMPMVLHNGSREAIMASLKYLFYSLCGAYGGLFGIVFLYRYCDSLTFTAGGTLNMTAVRGHEGILLAAVFVMILGFGAKAGMLPLHSWLPAAHPVAPSPASALLSGIIVKFGVLAVIRTVYYIVGPEFVRGTWVQYGWMILTLLTVFMGSMLAYREPVLKKRLAYSTVSQVSYILFGLSLLTPGAMTGALLHTAAHAFVKCGLFLTAGVFLYQCGYTRVDQLTGMGKKMPKTLWCYTVFALALIGIPPTAGFISKWYLAEGALGSGIPVFSWMGPVALLVSALLTAGYLLPITMKGFFPGEEAVSLDLSKKEPSPFLLVPLAVLAALALLLGILPDPLICYVSEIALSVFA